MQERWNDSSPHWFALKSQTKREHIAAKILDGIEGVNVFCPRIRFKKATRRGKIWWMEALFPGYLFAQFHFPELSRQVLASHGITGIVNFGGQIPHLPDSLIDQLKHQAQAASDQDDVILFTPSISAGDEVEIAQGAFQGVQGTVIEPNSAHDRVKILIELLGQEQVVDIDLYELLLPKKPTPAGT